MVQVVRASSDFEVPAVRRKLDKYELVAQLGSGGMAEVYLARLCGPMGFQKVVVLKTVHAHLAQQSEFITMFLDEARISALLKHPRVVDIYDLGHVDGTYYIAMEHLVGQPLSRVIAAGQKSEPLGVYATARIIADTAEGLAAAHELTSMTGEPLELVHRDMSPGNIVVLYDGNVKIVDFGIAKARGRLTESGLHKFKGKLGYVAPEQLLGAAVDRRSDIFALGVVLWEALTVRRLYRGDDAEAWRSICQQPLAAPSLYRPEVPPELDAIVGKATAPDPAHRYQTAGELQAALEDVLEQPAARGSRAAVAAFLGARFVRGRKAWERAIRKVAAASELSELDELDDLDIDMEVGEPDSGPSAPLPAADTPAPRRRRAAGAIAGAAAIALAIAGLGAYLARAEADAPPAATPRRVTAVAASAKPAPAPAPAPVEEAQPEPEPEPTPEPEQAEPARPAPEPHKPVVEDPRSAEQLTAEASRKFLAGELATAKNLYKAALRKEPRYAPAHRGLGLVYEKLGRKSSAVDAFERYLKLAPNAEDAEVIRQRIERLR